MFHHLKLQVLFVFLRRNNHDYENQRNYLSDSLDSLLISCLEIFCMFDFILLVNTKLRHCLFLLGLFGFILKFVSTFCIVTLDLYPFLLPFFPSFLSTGYTMICLRLREFLLKLYIKFIREVSLREKVTFIIG